MKLDIEDIGSTKIAGVSVIAADAFGLHEEDYFLWRPSPATAAFASGNITGGYVKAWRHAPARAGAIG
jgi:hypothetical protein